MRLVLTLIIKSDKDNTRKVQTNISHEHRFKNPHENINKQNPKMYKDIDNSNVIFPRNARLVQYSKIN